MHQVYAINLKKRTDRKRHIKSQFSNRAEFTLTIVEPKKHNIGAISLWETIQNIVKESMDGLEDYIIICEDDHRFTKTYHAQALNKHINEAKGKDADILLGGVSWFTDALQISDDLFWVEKFSGLQFTVIYRKFFKTILATKMKDGQAADYLISDLTQNILVISPFISTQKEFGYSDVTTKNNDDGRVNKIFRSSTKKLSYLDKVASFYNLKF